MRLIRAAIGDAPDQPDDGQDSFDVFVLSWLLVAVYIWWLPAVFRGMCADRDYSMFRGVRGIIR